MTLPGRRLSRGIALACLLGALLAGAAAAEQAPAAAAPEPRFSYALAHELMSPYCPGRTIASCPSTQAAELLQWMLLQEAAGSSREQVVAALEERFGKQIHSAPEAEGWGLAAWLLPGAALLVGAGLVAFVLRRMVTPARAAAGVAARSDARVQPAVAVSDAELERRLDAELAAGDR